MDINQYNRRTTDLILVFALLLVIIISLKFNNVLTAQNADDIIYTHTNELNTRKRVYELEMEVESLKHLIIETSGVPNEKRKAIFELKIEQDSILMDLLQGEINSNKSILNLLETDWEFNNYTEFKSLKSK